VGIADRSTGGGCSSSRRSARGGAPPGSPSGRSRLRERDYLYAFTAIGAAFSALDGPARGALTPSLVEYRQLPAAMALNQILFQTAAIAGPALAGVVILTFGVAGAYWIDVASFVVRSSP